MSNDKPVGTSMVFVNSDDKIILLLRDDIPTIKCPNCWDLVGGHPEGNETPEQCIVREVKEETEIEIINPKLFKVYEMEDRDEYTFWQKADFEIEDINLHEGQRLQWFSEEEIKNIPNDKIGFNFKPVILEFFQKKLY